MYDRDQDGYITREEIETIVDSIHKMVGQMVEFSEDDETPQTRVDKIFEAMDKVSPSQWPPHTLCEVVYSLKSLRE